MQQQDQSEKIDAGEEAEETSAETTVENDKETSSTETEDEQTEDTIKDDQSQHKRFDWLALIVALFIAAFFALTARFNSQPSPSYIPVAVFSATGCGLLVTALRKMRSLPGVGLLEAGLSGFGMAFLQFAVTFTYPNVFTTVTTVPEYNRAFLITWGLVALFAVVLSLAGAAIGHLAFAPLRPLPARAQKQSAGAEDDEELVEDDEEGDDGGAKVMPEQTTEESETSESNLELTEPANAADDSTGDENDEENDEEPAPAGTDTRPQRSLANYAVTVLLLGLLPMMVGYVFAASYDFIMNTINVNQISPALYPTLSLLSGLLPWRLAAPINLASVNGSFIVFTLLWRIPDSVLGNPNLFDVQALETFVFNAAGLALLLITMHGRDNTESKQQPVPWSMFLFLEALLGLIIILPATLWIQRGLEGVLQIQNLVAQLPTIQLLNPTLSILNLMTGTLFCLLIGLIVRRQYQLWTMPQSKRPEQSENEPEQPS